MDSITILTILGLSVIALLSLLAFLLCKIATKSDKRFHKIIEANTHDGFQAAVGKQPVSNSQTTDEPRGL